MRELCEGLGIWTQVLLQFQQTLYPAEPSPWPKDVLAAKRLFWEKSIDPYRVSVDHSKDLFAV